MIKQTLILIALGVLAFFVVPKAAWLWTGVGLVVGWNFLPQPQWVEDAVTAVQDWVAGLFR